MIHSQCFLDCIAKRRTYYQLSAESPISDVRIQTIIEDIILNVPSAFNSQTVRVILLLREEHRKLWDIVKEVLRSVVPKDVFAATEKKLNGFQTAYGTVSYGLPILLLCSCFSSTLRFYFSTIVPPSATFKKDSNTMPIKFLTGHTSQLACTNLLSGPPWKPKGSGQIYSIIILWLTQR